MIKHELFPTVIGEFHNEDRDFVKQVIVEEGFNYVKDGKANEVSNPFLHHNEKLQKFYLYVTNCVKDYIRAYMVDPENVNIFITKSYFNVMNNGCPRHHHKDSDLSFVYYVNVPPEQNFPTTFYAPEELPEPTSEFAKAYHCSEWNITNSRSWWFPAHEGKMFIFPGSLHHEVRESVEDVPLIGSADFLKYRVSIVGDIMLTFSESFRTSMTHGNYSPEQWRRFI